MSPEVTAEGNLKMGSASVTLEQVAYAAKLTARGYRRVSNRHQLVARIDRSDWLTVLAHDLRRSPAEFYVPREPEPAGTWCDHYRRVYSIDVLVVKERAVYMLVPGSSFDNCGYIRGDTR